MLIIRLYRLSLQPYNRTRLSSCGPFVVQAVGLQIIGDRHADLLVLQAARAWEIANPWKEKRLAL